MSSCFLMVSTHVCVRPSTAGHLRSYSRTEMSLSQPNLHSCFSRWALSSWRPGLILLDGALWLHFCHFHSLCFSSGAAIEDGWLCRASARLRLCFYSVFHTRHPAEGQTDRPVSYLISELQMRLYFAFILLSCSSEHDHYISDAVNSFCSNPCLTA